MPRCRLICIPRFVGAAPVRLIVSAMNPSAILPAVLVVPLPVAAASYPRIGAFLSRSGKRLRLLAAGCALGLVGSGLAAAGLVSVKGGFYFWAPLWQLVLVQVLYAAWLRLFAGWCRPQLGYGRPGG